MFDLNKYIWFKCFAIAHNPCKKNLKKTTIKIETEIGGNSLLTFPKCE
jgi:hypothetical protein